MAKKQPGGAKQKATKTRKKGGHAPKDAAAAGRLGQALKRLREGAGYTQARLSSESGLGIPTLSRYETGGRVPSVLTAIRLLGVMGKSLADLGAEWDAGGDGEG